MKKREEENKRSRTFFAKFWTFCRPKVKRVKVGDIEKVESIFFSYHCLREGGENEGERVRKFDQVERFVGLYSLLGCWNKFFQIKIRLWSDLITELRNFSYPAFLFFPSNYKRVPFSGLFRQAINLTIYVQNGFTFGKTFWTRYTRTYWYAYRFLMIAEVLFFFLKLQILSLLFG